MESVKEKRFWRQLNMQIQNSTTKNENTTKVNNYVFAFLLLAGAFIKYKRLWFVVLATLTGIFLIMFVIALSISCNWIENNNTKLFFLGGIGWFIAYWFTKKKEWNFKKFEIKQKSYSKFTILLVSKNVSIEQLSIGAATVCLCADDVVKSSIEKYLFAYSQKNKNQENLSLLKNNLIEDMRKDLYFSKLDLVDLVATAIKLYEKSKKEEINVE